MVHCLITHLDFMKDYGLKFFFITDNFSTQPGINQLNGFHENTRNIMN